MLRELCGRRRRTLRLILDCCPSPCYTTLQSGGKNFSFFNALRRHSQFPLGSASPRNRL